MKIAVRSIPSAGMDIQGAVSEEDLNIRPTEIKCLTPLLISGRATREGHVVHAWGMTKTRFHYVCACCLEEFDKDFDQEFDFNYAVEPQMSTIDLGNDIRQEIILSFPDRVLCDPACRGLCLGCGVDLNKEKCQCSKKD